MLTVEVRDLVRSYRTGSWWRGGGRTVTAVDGISFGVGKGEAVALLGPNGAGETTTVRVVATLLLPSRGTVRVLGMTAGADDQAIRRRIAFLFGGDRWTTSCTSPLCTESRAGGLGTGADGGVRARSIGPDSPAHHPYMLEAQ